MSLEVGDSVEVVWNDSGDGEYVGMKSRISDRRNGYQHRYRLENIVGSWFSDAELELTESKGGRNVSKIVDKLRELKLSKQDRILYKHGLIHETGQLTSDGKDAVLQASFDAVKDDLVADLKKIDAEEKK